MNNSKLDAIKVDCNLFTNSFESNPVNIISRHTFNNVVKWCKATNNTHLTLSKAIQLYLGYQESLIP